MGTSLVLSNSQSNHLLVPFKNQRYNKWLLTRSIATVNAVLSTRDAWISEIQLIIYSPSYTIIIKRFS